MAEIGIVVETIDENKVKVKLERTEACAKCGACTTGMQTNDMFIVADNICNASINDFVNIELESVYFFRAVGIMYGIPGILMLTGFFLGNHFAYLIPSMSQDILAFIVGILFLLLGYLGIKIAHMKTGDTKFIPTATRVVHEPKK